MMIISLAPRRFLIAAVSMAAALVPFSTIHAEMSAWAQGLGAAEYWTETERTERVRLLFIRKP
jgi:hypothetical protein